MSDLISRDRNKMASPSKRLILLITYLQANIILNTHGFTIPLKTAVTKCEIITKIPLECKHECTANDKLTSDIGTMTSDSKFSLLLPEESCARPSILSPLNPSGNCPFVNSQKSSPSSVAPKDVSLIPKTSLDALLNDGRSISLTDCTVNPLLGNCKPCDFKLPAAESSSISSITPLNLIPVAFVDTNTSVNLDDCAKKASTVCPLALSNESSLNSGLTACKSNPCATGFKSSLPVPSSNRRNYDIINLAIDKLQQILANRPIPIVSNSQNQNFPGQPEILLPYSIPNNSPLFKTYPLNNNMALSCLVTPGTASCNTVSCSIPEVNGNMNQTRIISPKISPQIPSVTYSDKYNDSVNIASPTMNENKLVTSGNEPSISPAIISNAPGLTSSLPSPCITEIPNSINKSQDFSNTAPGLLTLPSDMSCTFSSTNQSSSVPTSMQSNASNYVAPCFDFQGHLPLLSDLPAIELSPVLTVQGANNYNNVTMYPQSGYITPFHSNPNPDLNVFIPHEIGVLPSMSYLSINEYFQDVRAATAKLKDFISSFNSKFNSKQIHQLQSLVAPSKYASLESDALLLDEKCDLVPLIKSEKIVSPTTLSQPNIISVEDTVASESPNIISTQPCIDNFTSLSPSVLPDTCKAPVVPKAIISTFHYPIRPTPVQYNSLQHNIDSLSSCFSPYSFTDLPTISTNPYFNLGFWSNNLPDGSIIPTSWLSKSCFRPNFLPSVFKRPMLGSNLPNSVINYKDDVSSTLMPDVLSAVLPKSSHLLDSTSMRTSPDCEKITDPCVASSGFKENAMDSLCSSILSSPTVSLLSSNATLDESQLDLCCKNLEKMIALLESSMSFDADVDCKFDILPDILSF